MRDSLLVKCNLRLRAFIAVKDIREVEGAFEYITKRLVSMTSWLTYALNQDKMFNPCKIRSRV